MACGTGKTGVGKAVADELAADTALVVVPTLELLAQTAREYVAYGYTGRLLAVCSDADVLTGATAADSSDLAEELSGTAAHVSTRPDELSAAAEAPGRLVVFSTFASLPVIAAAHREHQLGPWPLIVVDEAHRSAGHKGKAWHAIHDDRTIPATRRLYMTATPRIMNSSVDESVSMDDPQVFGREAYRLPFAEAIDAGLLADYRVVVSMVTDAEIAALTDSHLVDVDGSTMPAQMLAAQIALLKASHEYGLGRIISYHHRVASAARFATMLPRTADLLAQDLMPSAQLTANWVSGEMTGPQRRAILAQLNNPGQDTVVIANARVLTEGVDVPDLDAVLFADQRSSPIDIVQAIGRALRTGGKPHKTAYVVIPVIVHADEDPAAVLESSPFSLVWQIVRALRAHDERLASWLDTSRSRAARTGSHATAQLGELPSWLLMHGSDVPAQFAHAITVRTVETGSSTWWENYGLAEDYFRRTGHLHPDKETDPELYRFVTNNRTRRKSGIVTADRVAALDRIGMVWDKRTANVEDHWRVLMAACKSYHDIHGDLRVHSAFRMPDNNFPLGSRLATVRGMARKDPESVPVDVKQQLDEWGIAWHKLDAKFAEFLEHLSHWRERGGDQDLDAGELCCDHYPLGARIKQKRNSHQQGRMPASQRKTLERSGLIMEIREYREDKLLAACDRWLDARRSDGVAAPVLNVPDDFIDSTGFRLGPALEYQRVQYARSLRDGQGGKPRSVDSDLVAELERRGMVWRRVAVRREVAEAELADLRTRAGLDQVQAVIKLINQGVTRCSIADGLGILSATLGYRISQVERGTWTGQIRV
ncbi:Helicase associated domain-containing protein [Amycolatopsis saalfeldensis]|uniref:Helicase associated domain-containing protein n=2 Tax=Amycolatopsis saalfeldensis TaxID=394193 RepID=A0A1H8YQU7_9PSEU|nr:Helicase associated domain-containing protein [Amycolatopsis saalfeldensis]